MGAASIEERPSFTCPRCGATSYNPTDVAEGYCGRCHDWTRGAHDRDEEVSSSCDVGAHACEAAVELWTVYDRPADFPTSIVARHWFVDDDGTLRSDAILVGASIDQVRAMLPEHLVMVPRDESDDPVIVETWL